MPRNPSNQIWLNEKMDSDYFRMKIVLIIFKLIGLAPWNIVRTSPRTRVSSNDASQTISRPQFVHSNIGCVYPICLAVTVFSMWIMEFPAPDNTENAGGLLVSSFIPVVYMIFGNTIAVAFRIMFCVKQNAVVELFNRFTTIDDALVRLDKRRKFESDGNFFVLLLSINALVMSVNIVSSGLCNGNIWSSLFRGILPDVTVNWFTMQYVVMVKLVTRQFQALNRALLTSSNFSDVQPISSIGTDCGSEIVTFRRIHTALYELDRDVSEFYSLPILFAIANGCFSAVCCSFFYVIPVLISGEFVSPCLIFHSLTWLVITMFPIVMLAASVNETDYEMRKTAKAVHELLTHGSISREDKTELRRFSLELLQRKVEFTANGLFPLDCTLLHSIFSGVVKYLVIIVQFQMAKSN